jgi:NADH dehydrogenase
MINSKKLKVVIAGGGFAGLSAAMYFDKGLARRPDIDVTLVSRQNFVLFTPMLHEVAAGELYPGDIVNPVRRILHHVRFVEAEVHGIDLDARVVRCIGGVGRLELDLEFDHLLVALGSETNSLDVPGVAEWAVTIKSLTDAALLRNRVVALLEEAALQNNEAARRTLLTFVAAGGGFAGVETIGALNDFVRDAVRHYPELNEASIRLVVVHPGRGLLPELGEELGRYAERKLCERGVDVITGARVARYVDSVVELDNGTAIPAETLIWTAGVKPSPVIESLRCRRLKDRLLVNEFLGVPDVPGLWAVGDSAAVPDGTAGSIHPPTAQHASREGRTAAQNIEATIVGRPLTSFAYSMQGQLATIGRRTGVAMVWGFRFSGFLAWWLWRTVYVMKLPRLTKKLRVLASWTLDLLFGTEIEQLVTLRDVDAVTEWRNRIRGREERRGAKT